MRGGYGSTEGFITFSHHRAVLTCSSTMGAVIESDMKPNKSEEEEQARPFVGGGRAGKDDDATSKYLSGRKLLSGEHRLVILRLMGVAPTGAALRYMYEAFVWITDCCTSEGSICFVMGVLVAVLAIGAGVIFNL